MVEWLKSEQERGDRQATAGTDRAGDERAGMIELRPVSFSAKVLQHGRHPANLGRLPDAEAQAIQTGWCGEVMEMYFRLDRGRITEAGFWADGCISTMACGDMLTGMVRNMTPAEALAVTAEALIPALDGLPYKSQHCAELSVETLRKALRPLSSACT